MFAALTALLNPMNLIGKIVDNVGGYFNKKQDVDLEKYRVKGNIDIEAMKQDTAIIQARAKLAETMKDDPSTKAARGWILGGISIYTVLDLYNRAFTNAFPKLTWEMIPLDATQQYVLYAVMAFLFALAWKGK